MPGGSFGRLVVLLQQGDGGLAGVWTLGTNYLPELITGLTNLGYRFVAPDPAME